MLIAANSNVVYDQVSDLVTYFSMGATQGSDINAIPMIPKSSPSNIKSSNNHESLPSVFLPDI